MSSLLLHSFFQFIPLDNPALGNMLQPPSHTLGTYLADFTFKCAVNDVVLQNLKGQRLELYQYSSEESESFQCYVLVVILWKFNSFLLG